MKMKCLPMVNDNVVTLELDLIFTVSAMQVWPES